MYNVVINQISLVKVLFILSVVSEVHYTLAYYNLTNVNIMKECFQRELMNDDGEQILTLQKIFLFPRSADGLCFTVNVTMEFERSRITDSSVQCTTGIGEANLRTESYTFVFQLSPAAPQADTDLIKALSSPTIKWMLTLLDPFFYLVLLSSLFSTGYYDYAEDYAEYYASVTVIEFRVQLYGIDSLGGIYSDVTDAIYSTLSWVSYINYYSMHVDSYIHYSDQCNPWLRFLLHRQKPILKIRAH